MSDDEFAGVDALLRQVKEHQKLPPPEERRRLREDSGLGVTEVARAVGVGRQTVLNWERVDGPSPRPPQRDRYLRLLRGLRDLQHGQQSAAESEVPSAAPATTNPPVPEPSKSKPEPEESAPDAPPGAEPCTRCGQPTTYRRRGEPRHLGNFCVPQQQPGRPSTGEQGTGGVDVVAAAVRDELERAEGDRDAALAALERRAIPDVMALFAATRVTGRYEPTLFPALPDILKKPSKKEPDQIWEARPSWNNPAFSRRKPGDTSVTVLDLNASYLAALKCWLPIGKLEWSDNGKHDKSRAGVYRITPPEWEHVDIPNPIGDREEPGPLWVSESTLRLLLWLSSPKQNMCAAPVIHESWTSGATENMLDKLRRVLSDARMGALENGDDVMYEYIKKMYSKFVATVGESADNSGICRPDWQHIIRSQATFNLYLRILKVRRAGCTIVRVTRTDELHVIGEEWRNVLPEGRGLGDVKVKPGGYLIGRTR